MATEREIDDLAAIIGSAGDALSRIQARDALAAGYRKFEIVDEPASQADGGPAFGELKQVGERAIKQGGLTIRDYFAIHASADEVTALQKRKHAERADDMPLNDFEARYLYADQMLKERAQ